MTPKATEERLVQIRNEAATAAPAAASSPQIEGHGSYYGLPALKAPVWTWEVPLYFFIGGIAGFSSCLAFIAHLFQGASVHADSSLIRYALWIGLIGAAICPALLIADLGRPTRFLNMLRVFKWKSAMSMGVWILVVYSGCAFLAVAGTELAIPSIEWLGESAGAFFGLLLASYTGVLLGATAIPVWFTHRRFLPAHFLTSGLGCSAAVLELCGFLIPPLQILGYFTAGLETVFEVMFEVRKSPVDAPLHEGRSGNLFRIAGFLEGPLALLIRMVWGSSNNGRYAAGLCFMIGALLSRYAWIWAGRASAKQPDVQFAQQRAGGSKP
jgi:hypothetical protein